MVFRKYAVNHRSMQIVCLACIAGSVLDLMELWPLFAENMPVCLFFGAVDVILLLLTIFDPWSEKLRIDETGICCLRRKRVLWSLSWEEIEKISPARVYRCRGYVIVPKIAPVRDLHNPESIPNFEIQHTKALRDTLLVYGSKLE